MAKAKPKKPKGTYVAGQGTGPSVAAGITAAAKAKKGPQKDTTVTEELVKQRHDDWVEHWMDWQRFQDSFEGGARYRNAVYGMDRTGLPIRNLFRHKREYPDPQQFPNAQSGFSGYGFGTGPGPIGATESTGPYPGMLGADAGATAADDAYESRRARTPVPPFVEEVIKIWLGKVYDQEVSREGPPEIEAFWEDVDGCGTNIDDYMREVIAPLFLVCGLLDVVVDRPARPDGVKAEDVKTRRDEKTLGLDKVVVSYILPQNMVWYRVDIAGRYTECLVREYVDAADRRSYTEDGQPIDPEDVGEVGESWRRDYVRWRHWTTTGSVLYSYDGKEVHEDVPHNYGRVPIPRLIDQRKHRTRMVGKSRMETIADYQRAYYNKDSELTISDTLQALPFLSGPEDYCKADNTISVGPNFLLPKKKNIESGSYEGFEYVSPPKDPAASLRTNCQDIVDMKDRIAGLTKPAGASGTSKGTVGQSGIAKQIDSVGGHKILSDVARSLAKAERTLAEYAYLVLHGEPPNQAAKDSIKVGYPTRFDLKSDKEIGEATTMIQQIIGASGNCPNLERELIQAMYKQTLIGLSDEAYREIDAEIELLVETRATIVEQVREINTDAISGDNALDGGGTELSASQESNVGQSAATQLSGSAVLGY